ncbi:MAG: peptidylprolyl isomerase [Acidimicrobiia bacterium]
MKRLIPLLVALGLVLAACGGSSSEVAATVGDTEIPVSEIEELTGQSGDELDSSSQAFSQALTTLITWSITEQAAAEQFGYTPTEDEIEEQLETILGNAGYESLDQMAEAEGVAEKTLRRYIVQLMTQDAIYAELQATVEAPTAEDVNNEIAVAPRNWTTVCASHILVVTEEEAQDALARISDEGDFAVVATEVSTDTQSAINGGSLGCAAAGSFVDSFAQATVDAPIGEVVGPVETEFGYHLILVTERTEATNEEVSAALTEASIASVADEWFVAVTDAAVVVVSEGFGTWVTDPTPQIVVTSEG